jgi:hypothetical protein
MGIEVVPTWKAEIQPVLAGNRYPCPTPTNIARKIQSVRYRSKNDSFFTTPSVICLLLQDASFHGPIASSYVEVRI